MTDGVENHRSSNWLVGLAVLLAVILLAQSLLIFKMWKAQSGGSASLVSWTRDQAARICSNEARRSAPSGKDDTKMLVLQSADDLENIHSRLNSILNEMMADFERTSMTSIPVASLPPGRRAMALRRPPTFMLDDVARIQRELNSIFENALFEPAISSLPDRFGADWQDVSTSASMQFKDDGDSYRISIPLPGMDRTNIEIRLEGQILSIAADQRSRGQTEAPDDAIPDEFARRRFETRIRLPAPVDADQAQASYREDILRIEAPKKTEAQQVERLIAVH